MKFSTVICYSLWVLAFTACSGGGGGGNGGTGGNGPRSKEEALQKLSPEHRANFEAWQSKLVKACDSAEAFGLDKENKMQPEGLDGAALIKANHGSVVFIDGNYFSILTGYNTFSGVVSTKTEKSIEINGQGYSITAETKREGSTCTVYLYGQEVYKTIVVESFTVGTQYSLNKEASALSQPPVVKTLGNNGAAEVLQHGLFSLLSQSLKPSREAQVFIGGRLGLNSEQSERLLKLSTYTSGDSAIRFDSDPSSVWSNAESGNLISQASKLKKYFDGTAKNVALEVRLQIPQFDFEGTKNNSDNGNVKLILTSAITKKDNSYSYTLKHIEGVEFVAFDQSEAELCSKDRLAAYLGELSPNKSISPSTRVLFSPCKTIFPDIEIQSYQNGFLKSLLPIIFANVNPSGQLQYGGWDYVLGHFSKEAIAKGLDIQTDLDPANKTKIVSIVANHLKAISGEIEKSKNMRASKDLALQMGLDWSFRGLNISNSRISQIIQSTDNAADTFKVSSERLLLDMAKNPNANDEQLDFALNMSPAYKAEAQKALNLSRELSYSQFESDIFGQTIQKRTSIDEFKYWSNQFSTIKSEMNKYPTLASVKGELVGLSLKWLKNGELNQADLGGVYSALNNSIDPFTESTKTLVGELGQSLGANKEVLEFARALTQEYKQLAVAIRDNSAAAEYASWGQAFFNSVLQNRPGIEKLRQWNDLWASSLAFVRREKARVEGEFSSMPEWNRKKVIEIAVNETWSGQDFAALETLAPAAKGKSVCERHKDISSLADCAGMSLFSKGHQKFFDPAFGGRYLSLGADFNDYINRFSGFDWFSLRRELVSELFGTWEPIWSKCDNSVFNQKAATLKTQLNTIASESDQFKKWELERKIRETIRNCQ
ncbi:MAG: hypothetical protein IPM97_05245 [Bdellovibrionaceae bacterium]|nr:hypothetical protein [Pseudobdellovibrionaceae bacterium]